MLKEKLNLPKDTPNEVYMKAVIEKIGLDKLKKCLPEKLPVLCEAYKTDKNLNNIPLKKWDQACGYLVFNTQPPHYKAQPWNTFQRLLAENFQQTLPVSHSVSILKHAARMLIQQEGCV